MTPITREQARELAVKHGLILTFPGTPEYIVTPEEIAALLTDFRQQVIDDLARESGTSDDLFYIDGFIARCNGEARGSFPAVNRLRETIASLQAKLEQSEARAQKIREAVDDAAYEWGQYVEVDRAPMTLQKYIVQAIDAALNKEPKA